MLRIVSGATNVPRKGRVSTRPSCSRRTSALRTGVLLMRRLRASLPSMTASPGRKFRRMMADLMVRYASSLRCRLSRTGRSCSSSIPTAIQFLNAVTSEPAQPPTDILDCRPPFPRTEYSIPPPDAWSRAAVSSVGAVPGSLEFGQIRQPRVGRTLGQIHRNVFAPQVRPLARPVQVVVEVARERTRGLDPKLGGVAAVLAQIAVHPRDHVRRRRTPHVAAGAVDHVAQGHGFPQLAVCAFEMGNPPVAEARRTPQLAIVEAAKPDRDAARRARIQPTRGDRMPRIFVVDHQLFRPQPPHEPDLRRESRAAAMKVLVAPLVLAFACAEAHPEAEAAARQQVQLHGHLG